MSCKNFKESLLDWLQLEQEASKYLAGDSSLVTAALAGGVILAQDDIAKLRPRALEPLELERQTVLREINNHNDNFTSMVFEGQANLLDQIVDAVNYAQDRLSTLKDMLAVGAPYSPNKNNLDSVISDLQQIMEEQGREETQEEPQDFLSELVDRGVIDQQDVEDYLTGKNIDRSLKTRNRIQLVQQLRDRYYTIASAPEELELEGVQTFKLIDVGSNSEIEDVFGYEDLSLNIDGTIDYFFADGSQRTVRIEPQRRRSRPKRGGKKSTLKVEAISAIQEDMSYEIFACAVLDIVEFIYDKWIDIKRKFDRFRASMARLKGMSLGDAVNGVFGFNKVAFGSAARLRSLTKIKTPEIGSIASQIFGIQNTFKKTSLGDSRGASLCEFSKQNYCAVKRNVELFIETLVAELDQILPEIPEPDGIELNRKFEEIDKFIDEFIAKSLEVDAAIEDARGAVCNFVSRRLKGVPKKLSRLEESLVAIAIVMTGMPILRPTILGLQQSEAIKNITKTLKRNGFDVVADLLEDGDISGFLNTNIFSYPDKVADCLKRKALEAESPSRSRRLSKLAAIADTRGDRITIGKRISDGMRSRFHAINNELQAKFVKEEAERNV